MAEDSKELLWEVKRGKITFHEQYWKKVSTLGKSLSFLRCPLQDSDPRFFFEPVLTTGIIAKDFIKALLVVDPKDRLSSQQALEHPVISPFPTRSWVLQLTRRSVAHIWSSYGS